MFPKLSAFCFLAALCLSFFMTSAYTSENERNETPKEAFEKKLQEAKKLQKEMEEKRETSELEIATDTVLSEEETPKQKFERQLREAQRGPEYFENEYEEAKEKLESGNILEDQEIEKLHKSKEILSFPEEKLQPEVKSEQMKLYMKLLDIEKKRGLSDDQLFDIEVSFLEKSLEEQRDFLSKEEKRLQVESKIECPSANVIKDLVSNAPTEVEFKRLVRREGSKNEKGYSVFVQQADRNETKSWEETQKGVSIDFQMNVRQPKPQINDEADLKKTTCYYTISKNPEWRMIVFVTENIE